MKLFLQKNAKFSIAWGSPPDPRASGGWGLCPQTPIGLRRLDAPSPSNCEFLATRLRNTVVRFCTKVCRFDRTSSKMSSEM